MGTVRYKVIEKDGQEIVKEIHKIVVHQFYMGDVEDPDIYAAEPIWNWEKSEQGQFLKWILLPAYSLMQRDPSAHQRRGAKISWRLLRRILDHAKSSRHKPVEIRFGLSAVWMPVHVCCTLLPRHFITEFRFCLSQLQHTI